MKLGTTYICVEDIEKSLNFYRALLQQEPLYCNDEQMDQLCLRDFSLQQKI